jgi:hypothetical protein
MDLGAPLKIRAFVEMTKNTSHPYKCISIGGSFEKHFLRQF